MEATGIICPIEPGNGSQRSDSGAYKKPLRNAGFVQVVGNSLHAYEIVDTAWVAWYLMEFGGSNPTAIGKLQQSVT